jgi:hypothetical protein
VRLLPSEVSRIRYEDLRAILLDYYREHKPRSILKRYTGDWTAQEIAARRGDKKYRGVTDETGSFHIHVPPGRYTVWPETLRWIVTPYDFSYDNEDHVVVERGGCAELQFMAAPKLQKKRRVHVDCLSR